MRVKRGTRKERGEREERDNRYGEGKGGRADRKKVDRKQRDK